MGRHSIDAYHDRIPCGYKVMKPQDVVLWLLIFVGKIILLWQASYLEYIMKKRNILIKFYLTTSRYGI